VPTLWSMDDTRWQWTFLSAAMSPLVVWFVSLVNKVFNSMLSTNILDVDWPRYPVLDRGFQWWDVVSRHVADSRWCDFCYTWGWC
jgi:hypothetical protein